MTDDWGELLNALERVRAAARNTITDEESRRLEDVIHEVQLVLTRRS